MRNTTRVLAALAGAAALTLAVTLPANADTSDTTATVEVQAGALSIAAPAAMTLSAALPGATSTGTLSGVEVSDLRAGAAGWITTATITDFTSASTTATIPSTAVSFATATADVVGTATVTPSNGGAGTGTLQTATAVTGNNTATWDQTINVAVPADALAATDYTATLTYSVL